MDTSRPPIPVRYHHTCVVDGRSSMRQPRHEQRGLLAAGLPRPARLGAPAQKQYDRVRIGLGRGFGGVAAESETPQIRVGDTHHLQVLVQHCPIPLSGRQTHRERSHGFSLSGQSQTTTSHERHTPGDTPHRRPNHPTRATSRNRSDNPGEGLRFNELRHLQTVDFSRNAHAGEFGGYGVVQVRYGKAKKGSPPKRRGVLTVFTWTPEVITDWLAHGQPAMTDGLDLFPSERGALVAENTLLRRFRRYCRELELPDGLDLHSLRRSYATHLIEDGWDAKFVQDQMGHDHASTTSLYTCVSSDYRVSTLRRVLDTTINTALSLGEESL